MLTADHIIDRVAASDAYDKYKNHRTAILAGYFDHVTEINPKEVILTGEVSKLLMWTLSKD